MNRFEDKAIIVTGAGSGIGAACVQRIFSEGDTVAIAGVNQAGTDRMIGAVVSVDGGQTACIPSV